ncbi:STAS domain-containing protein [Amycolatopsis thermophila]|uniref:RsbT co-antagonist protein RsbR n=1 Tax=Amycolatopsis thermophila TaxID=206084 RepID=A0ABU0EWH1_9PSEU|nr:STAS domain-containing protein [Amycolatopsis thermophila]MDQ0379463.1 rsbT co-antagonist protein RsbR [Amycolatopsis thermophila]
MTTTSDRKITSVVSDFLDEQRETIVALWADSPFFRSVSQDSDQAAGDSAEILRGLRKAIAAGDVDNPGTEGFDELRSLLTALAAQLDGTEGVSPRTAVQVSQLKDPLLRLWRESAPDPELLTDGALVLSGAVDTLRLVLVESALASAKETLAIQREQLTELSTPVIKLWDGVLAIPLIGTLDSMRSQVATESLLQSIMTHQAKVAILDITGVPTVDTMVAQHLLKTAMAARLMGAECVISGIRPQIANTMVQLGIDLGEVATRARLADALAYALNRLGLEVGSSAGPGVV